MKNTMKDYISATERMVWPKKRKRISDDVMWSAVVLGIFVFYMLNLQ